MAADDYINMKEVTLTEIKEEVTGEAIKSLRFSLGQSQAEFGLTLKHALDPKAIRGFSRQYISGLELGSKEYTITPEIQAAYWAVKEHLVNHQPAGVGGTQVVSIMALPGKIPPGIVPYLSQTAEVKQCARPGCPVWFIKTNPFQKYHDPECRPTRK